MWFGCNTRNDSLSKNLLIINKDWYQISILCIWSIKYKGMIVKSEIGSDFYWLINSMIFYVMFGVVLGAMCWDWYIHILLRTIELSMEFWCEFELFECECRFMSVVSVLSVSSVVFHDCIVVWFEFWDRIVLWLLLWFVDNIVIWLSGYLEYRDLFCG